MFFKRVFDPDLAQASYLVGCQATGEAMVVDPRRDVGVYLDEAAAEGLTIVAVTETHIHADYLSGSRELAEAAGSALYLSDEGGADWRYGIDHEPLRDGDEIRLGNLTVRALHTPGHTPEHLSFLVTDGALTERPGYLLSGDFVFVGDVGRPDLLDEAAGGVDTRWQGARDLYDSLDRVFLQLPDWVQVWPGHGAGSACGKALGAVPSTTVGYERVTAWWRDHLERGDVDGFVDALLEGQPDAPSYFGRMKRQNRAGPATLGRLAPLRAVTADEVRARLGDELVLLDTRPEAQSLAAAIPGALAVPAGKSFATYASYALDPERDERDVVVLADDAETAERLRARLVRVGIDRVVGYLPSLAGLELEPVPTVPPGALDAAGEPLEPGGAPAFVLDVRTRPEYEAGHVPGARQLHVGRLLARLDEIPRDRPVVVHCQTGARSAVAASLLRAAGFDRVLELEGSYDAWRDAHPNGSETGPGAPQPGNGRAAASAAAVSAEERSAGRAPDSLTTTV